MDADLFVTFMCDDSSDKGCDHTDKGTVYKNIKEVKMRKFTKDDYDLVKKYEKDFTRAIESRYCTGLLKEELEVVSKVYIATLNRQANLSCGGCVLQMMTSVGRLYLAYKKEAAAAEEELKKEKKTRVRRKKNEDKIEDQAS
jgi:hypothetical protein